MPREKTFLNRLEKLGVRFETAVRKNLNEIKALLLDCNLPNEDIDLHLNNFIAAKIKGKLIGIIGLESYGRVGLLRSFAVDPGYRGKGIANELFREILLLAAERGVREAYLLTTSIEKTCGKLGFEAIDRANIPQAIKNTGEFAKLCPKSAVCMYRLLSPAE
jgi:amino-acid N-acetyltransferase